MNDQQHPDGYILGFNPAREFLSAECRRFAETWQKWRGQKLLPERRDVDLADVKDLLPSMVVADVQSAEVVLVRLIGTDFHPHFGAEITGANFVDLAPPADRPLRGYRQMCMSRHPCASVSRIRAESDDGKATVTEIAAFPVATGKADMPPQVFACTHMLQQDYVPAEDNKEGGVKIPVAAEFSFLDIGAGTPPEKPF